MTLSPVLQALLEKYGLTEDLNTIKEKKDEINYSNFNTLELNSEVEKGFPELFKSGFGLGRADLASIQSSMAAPSKEFDEVILDLKPYLRPPDHAALIAATAVVKSENEGKNTEILRKLLDKCYGSRGRRVYNMLRSDVDHGKNIFQAIIIPFLKEAKKTYPDDEIRVTGLFTLFFEEIIKNFPNAIWISDNSAVAATAKKAEKMLEKIPEVFIFARGIGFIKTAERVCKEVECEVEKLKYSLGTQQACRYTLRPRNKNA